MKRQIAHRMGIILLSLICAGVARAQMVVSVKSGIIQYAEGEVFLDNRPLQLPRGGYHQMVNGQTLQTRRGRLEMLLAPDAYLRLAEDGSLQMEQTPLTDIQLAFEGGSALIEVVQRLQAGPIRVHFSTGLVEIREAGLYRFDASSRELRVYGGSALVSDEHRKSKVKRGRKVCMDGIMASTVFNVDAADELHKWAAQRSFDLFNASPNSRMQRHWEPISMGWLINYNYHVRLFSAFYFERWRVAQTAREAADEKAREQAIEVAREAAAEQAVAERAAIQAARQAADSQRTK